MNNLAHLSTTLNTYSKKQHSMSESQGEKLQLYFKTTRKSMEQIAHDLELSRSTLYAKFKEQTLDESFLSLLREKGYNFLGDAMEVVNENSVNFPKDNIVFIPLAELGGFLSNKTHNQYMKTLEKFSLPGVHGQHYAFEMQGSSMSPKIEAGDKLITKQQPNTNFMVEGQDYVIQLENSAIIKRLVKIQDDTFMFASFKKDAPQIKVKSIEIKGVFLIVGIFRNYIQTTEISMNW